ncbi:1-phosphofructokinase family hexose kinase [Gordonia rhizosphera]|uniref:6-phosphofructokinase II n=1 Tax=Gordonia rhizosphera NBRC 16068 TaxID=1108045 RepID=K6VVG8_9ACTN|nr:1-phosphofructokinase family hexose kinase [Gordonia rhizosphera]GAB90870.1 6-phosphofructokinase II [Gordonia rhizosphera NBRC 16068]
MAPIATVTINPALDIHTSVPRVRPTDKLRCTDPRYDPGGGGINVALAITSLGGSATAILTTGGYTGARVQSLLDAGGLDTHAVAIAEPTRECLTVTEDSTNDQYRFVLPGPHLRPDEERQVLQTIDQVVSPGAFLVVSGSLPPGCSADIFNRVADIAGRHDCSLVVDTSGPAFGSVRGARFVKPSVRELRDHTGLPLPDEASQADAARTVIGEGISDAVVISRGGAGALVVTASDAVVIDPVEVPQGVGSGVGAGDAMVAAITLALSHEWPFVEAVRLGMAAGAAALLTPGTEPCRRRDVERLYGRALEW